MTHLIVNADDLGLSRGINRGIFEAHRRGIVTSASLMVRWPAAAEAVEACRGFPGLGLGLHVDLGEWAYRDGAWALVYQVVQPEDAGAVAREVADQLKAFRRLVGRDPTHLDSHQHAHREEPLRSVLVDLAGRLSVPLRHCTSGIRYCGDFYGQASRGEPLAEAITPAALLRILSSLPEGVIELACHPGYADGMETMYGMERAREVETLCHPLIRTAIGDHSIELSTFQEISSLLVTVS